MDDRELRQQLLRCTDRPLEAAMYDALGSKINTISETDMMEELGKLAVEETIAVEEIIAMVEDMYYSTVISEEKPAHSSLSSLSKVQLTVAQLTVAQQSIHQPGKIPRASMDLLPGEVPRRSTSTQYLQEDKCQDLASEDQHKTWHQKTSTRPGTRRPAQTWHQKTSKRPGTRRPAQTWLKKPFRQRRSLQANKFEDKILATWWGDKILAYKSGDEILTNQWKEKILATRWEDKILA